MPSGGLQTRMSMSGVENEKAPVRMSGSGSKSVQVNVESVILEVELEKIQSAVLVK